MFGLNELVGNFPYMGLFILLILGAIGFPFPEGITLIICGFLIFNNVIEPLPAIMVAYSGILIGDLIAYSIGRKYGRMVVTHKRFQWIISTAQLSKLENKFNKKGALFIMIGGHLLGEIFLVAGVMKMPVNKFLIADAIAALFAIAIWTGIGYIGGNSLEIIKEDISRVEHIGILFAIIVISIYLLFRYFKSRSDRTTQ
jgi:membrane protein DedA with SNARE-associated domain